jgi:hypothetical protein
MPKLQKRRPASKMPDTDDKVGYGRPPKHSRFQPGQSGNSRGRPRGTKNLATDLREELAERIPIREGERSLQVSKQRALLKAMMARALKGDARSAAILLGLMAKVLEPEGSAHDGDGLDANDAAILENFLSRRSVPPTSTGED